MSAHPTPEQLSAWLDRELPGADQATVEAHLRECPACAAAAEEMAAIDALAREAPEPAAPPGYFDAFPARVRQGLPQPRWRPARLAWVGAVAAALLAAVVTPRLLRETPPAAMPGGSLDRQANAPAPPAAMPAEPGSSLPQAEGAPLQQSAGTPPPPRADALTARDKEQAPGEAGSVARTRAFAAPPQALQDAPTKAAPAPVEADRAADNVAVPRYAPAPASAPQATGAVAGGVVGGLGVAGGGAAPAAAPAPRREAAESADLDERGGAQEEPAAMAKAVRAPGAAEKKAAASLADLRRQRDRSREAAASEADGAVADGERVRALELGLAAWRASHDPEDLRLLRADGAAYVARADARQTGRARDILKQAAAQR